MLKNVLTSSIAALGAVLFMFAPGEYWWLVGASIFVVAWLLLLLVIIPFMKVPRRGQLASLAVTALMAGLGAMALMGIVQWNDLISRLDEAWGVWPFIGSRLWAAFWGTIIAAVVSSIFLFFVGYFSSIYIVGLHEEEVGFWDAFKSFVFLVLDVNLAWLLVEDGDIHELKKQGFVNKWLSRGKIIIKPGNAIVTEKGGAITDIRGPGVKLTVKDERIREVFDLRPQFELHELDNVITADQIPLEIEFGVGYRLTPASDSDLDADSVIKEKNFGVYAVEQETLKKAAFNGAGWKGFGANAPVGQLRDQIMAHTFEELFEVTPDPNDPDDLIIKVDRRRIKRIENAITEILKRFADANMGVTYTVIDIRKIGLPRDVAEAVHMRIKATAEAEAIEKIEGQRNSARGGMVTKILDSISEKTDHIGAIELQLAAAFAQISRRALTDDVLGHQYVQMLTALAEGQATKIFNATPGTSALEPTTLPPFSIHLNGSDEKNNTPRQLTPKGEG